MQIQLECIPCFIRQGLDALRQVTDDEEIIIKALRRVLKEASELDFSLSPPAMAQQIHNIIKEESGNADPYAKIKDQADKYALALYDDIKEKIINSPDLFVSALRFSISGNIMDFALLSAWDNERIQSSFEKALHHPLDEKTAHKLESDIKTAKTILLLGDNTGETVFDKLFIETMDTKGEIYYAVKESPIINDATFDDAIKVGLNDVAKVISNGTNAPGTLLNHCSKEFLNIYYKADVVIAKGQANFETLNDETRKIYFLTQIKCSVIANKYTYNVGDWLVVTTNQLKALQEVTT